MGRIMRSFIKIATFYEMYVNAKKCGTFMTTKEYKTFNDYFGLGNTIPTIPLVKEYKYLGIWLAPPKTHIPKQPSTALQAPYPREYAVFTQTLI